MSQEEQALPILRDDERHYDAVKIAINLLVSINNNFPLEGDLADKRNRVGEFQRDAIMLFTWRELFAFQVVFSEEYGEHFTPSGYCSSDDVLRRARGFVECFCQDRRIPRTELTALGFWVNKTAESEFPQNMDGGELWDEVLPKSLSNNEKTTLDELIKELRSADRRLRGYLFGAIAKDAFKYDQTRPSAKHRDTSKASDFTTTIANKEPVKQAIKQLNSKLKKAAREYVSGLATDDEKTQGFRVVVMAFGRTLEARDPKSAHTDEEQLLRNLAESLAKLLTRPTSNRMDESPLSERMKRDAEWLAKATPQAVRKVIKDVDPKRIEKVLVERAAHLFTSATSWDMPSKPVVSSGVAQKAFRNLQEAMFAELPRSPLALPNWIEKQKKDRGFKQEENGLIYINQRKKPESVVPVVAVVAPTNTKGQEQPWHEGRLLIKKSESTIELDRKPFKIENPLALAYFEAIYDAMPGVITQGTIKTRIVFASQTSKLKNQLPDELKAIVQGGRGSKGGLRIVLPPKK